VESALIWRKKRAKRTEKLKPWRKGGKDRNDRISTSEKIISAGRERQKFFSEREMGLRPLSERNDEEEYSGKN